VGSRWQRVGGVERPPTSIVEVILGRGADEVNRAILAGRMRTLAANLATAGALCRAYLSGVYAASSWLSGQLDGQNAWEPGCGRLMPGWGGVE